MSVNFQTLTPNLLVDDVNKTVNFYMDTLGFTLLRTVPEKGTFDWAMLKRDNVVIMFQSKQSLKKDIPKYNPSSPGVGTTLYFRMDGVRDFFNEINERVEIVADVEHTFYDTIEFSIIDLNGYILTFSQEAK